MTLTKFAADTWRELDRKAFELIRVHRTESRTKIARAVSALAEPGVAYPVLGLASIAGAAADWRRRDRLRCGGRPVHGVPGWWQACAPLLAVAGGALVRRALSETVARPRPPEQDWLAKPEGFSLPSRHTTMAALTAGTVARALGTGGRPEITASLVAAAGVGASRIYLGVHWPGDVAAGWLFAVGWLRLTRGLAPTTAILKTTRRRGSPPSSGCEFRKEIMRRLLPTVPTW